MLLHKITDQELQDMIPCGLNPYYANDGSTDAVSSSLDANHAAHANTRPSFNNLMLEHNMDAKHGSPQNIWGIYWGSALCCIQHIL